MNRVRVWFHADDHHPIQLASNTRFCGALYLRMCFDHLRVLLTHGCQLSVEHLEGFLRLCDLAVVDPHHVQCRAHSCSHDAIAPGPGKAKAVSCPQHPHLLPQRLNFRGGCLAVLMPRLLWHNPRTSALGSWCQDGSFVYLTLSLYLKFELGHLWTPHTPRVSHSRALMSTGKKHNGIVNGAVIICKIKSSQHRVPAGKEQKRTVTNLVFESCSVLLWL